MTSKEYGSPVNLPSSNIDEGGVNDRKFNNITCNPCRSSFTGIFFPFSKSKLSNSIFFCVLPPVKTYFRALGAIHTLADSDAISSTDEESKRTTLRYYLRKSDAGFRELIAILNENNSFGENGYFGERTREVDEICYSQTVPKLSYEETLTTLVQVFTRPNLLFSKLMPECETTVTASINNVKIITRLYGDRNPLVDFTQAVEDYIRRKFATYAIWSIFAYLILNALLLLYVNIIFQK